MALKTFFNNILVKLIEDESPVVLSDDIYRPQRAIVVTTGAGTKDMPMQVKKDDIIFFYKANKTKLEYNDEDYYVLSQLDVIAQEEK